MQELTANSHSEDSTSQHLPQPYHKGITIEDITYLMEVEGLTITQTALRLGCDKSNITDHLKRNNIVPGYLQNFNKNKAKAYAHIQERILKSISTDDIKKASLSQKIVGIGVLADKERTELGLVTETIGYVDLVKVNEQTKQRMQELESKLGISKDDLG
jgi:hypothetical protein